MTTVHRMFYTAFPRTLPYPNLGDINANMYEGMTILEYFMAHAPAEPQAWFEPEMENPETIMPDELLIAYNMAQNHLQFSVLYEMPMYKKWWETAIVYRKEKEKQKYIQWPIAWAREVIRTLEKH